MPPELIGTRDYYLWRDANAPEQIRGDNYYVNFGLKKFDEFQRLRAGASPRLQRFIDRAGIELQRRLEQVLQSNPAIELNRSTLKLAAWDTHSDAYLAADYWDGMSIYDRGRVNRIGFRDLFSAGFGAGIREVWQLYTDPRP